MTLTSTYSPKRRRRAIVATIALTAAVAVTVVSIVQHDRNRPPTCSVSSVGGERYRLDPDQAQNASIIAAVGSRLGVPDHGVTVALATALQETQLRNLPYGDRDSRGLFQQRPSQGWGTSAQVMDPAYAAAAFFRHLLAVQGWQGIAVAAAADDVQHSAAPQAYAIWEPRARALATALTGEVPAGLLCRFSAFSGAPPAAGDLRAAASSQFGAPVLTENVPAKLAWRTATWVVAHAYRYHVASVGYGGRRWTASSGVWSAVPTTGAAVVVTSCSGPRPKSCAPPSP